MKRSAAWACLPFIWLAGCASNTGVVPMGGGVYMSAKQQATGFPGLGNMKAELLVEANAFCQAQGKSLQLLSQVETQPPYVLGNYPRAEIRFRCTYAETPPPTPKPPAAA